MSNSTPEIPGYRLDQRLLQHPLAELWHGRTFTGMEIVALVLSEDGARDETVRDRLVQVSRHAALEPERSETPLWAGNFTSQRPYAITQLIPGQSGAERLLDPLDGIIGNDAESLRAVRTQLSGYGAMPPELPPSDLPSYVDHPTSPTSPPPDGHPQTQPAAQSKIEVAREYRRKIGAWIYVVVVLVVLIVFSITYSIGAAIASSVKPEAKEAAPPAAVSPSAFPSSVLLPPVERITTAPYKRPDGSAGVFGAVYPAGADLQVVTNAELPFALGWPRPPEVIFLGESSSLVLRRVVTRSDFASGGVETSFKADIALHPCVSLAQCLADRPSFDQQWTRIFKAPAPATAKDARTWLTVQASPYLITMTRAFRSGGQWWLAGAAVTTLRKGEEPDVQRIVNDIWRQTS